LKEADMKGKIRFFGLIMILALVAGVIVTTAVGWAQKAAKPPKPPQPPADPAIAFCAESSWASSDLMVMNADGTNQKVLLAGTKKPSISNHDPSWSPDGARLAFYSDVQGPGIYIINKDGSGLCKVITMNEGGSYGAGNPQWSPDGVYILYSDTEGPGTTEDLYLVEAVCGSPTRINLTKSPEGEFYAAWSPDGTQVATCVVGDNIADVIIYNLVIGDDGAISAVFLRDLTATGPLQGAFCAEIDWANSSNKIAVRAANNDIWVIDAVIPGLADNLTNTPLIVDRDPSWAPLDAKIVFACADYLYTMNPDGTGVTRLASPPAPNKYLRGPDWRRNL
jgi:Tol biopolymer transport system component